MKSPPFTRLFLLLFSSFLATIVQAQVFEDFETHSCAVDFSCSSAPPGLGFFYPGLDGNQCLNNWAVSHGTPSINENGLIEGNNSLLLAYWNNESFPNFRSEGAFMGANIDSGKCYEISFKTRFLGLNEETLPPPTLEVEFANGLTHQTNNCLGLPPNISSSQNIFSINIDDLDGDFGQIFTYSDVITADDNYSQLWFYLDPGNSYIQINGGSLFIDDVVINEVDCNFPCTCFDGIKLGSDGAVTPISNYSSSTIQGAQCMAIAGTLEIDVSYTLNGKEFIMQPGAEIRIKNGFNLDIFNGTMEGCIQMWKGIVVEDGGALRMVNTDVRDAQYSILALDGSSIGVANNQFDDNFIGLMIDGTNPSENNGAVTILGAGAATINSNQFYHVNGLLPAYDNQFPSPKERTQAGIFLKNVDNIPIGNALNPFTPNTFFKTKNGILLDHSTATIHQNKFTDLGGTEANGFPFDHLGVGIYLDNGSDAFIANNDFNTFFMGVIAEASSLTADKNNIAVNTRCIYVIDPIMENIAITENQLAADFRAILIENANPAEDIHIEANVLDMDGAGSNSIGCIELVNCNPTVPENGGYTIIDNYIQNNAFNSGIEIFSSSGVLIQGNTIDANIPTYFTTGIRLVGSSQCRVRQNTITGIGIQDNCNNSINTLTSRAILVDNTGASLYCCNIMDETTLGISFDGACGKSNIRRNQFYTHQHGLYYAAGTQSSIQQYPGNKWHENNCNLDALHAGGTTEAALAAHTVYAPHAPFDHSPANLFTIDPTLIEVNCGESEDCGIPTWEFGPDPNDQLVATGQVPHSFNGTAIPWMEQRRLYEALALDPIKIEQSTEIANFFRTHNNGEIGWLYKVENDLRQLLAKSQNNSISISEGLQKILAENSNLQTTTDWGLKQKKFNTIYLQYWIQNRTLSKGQQKDLETMALACPKIDGKVVYQARSLHQVVTQAFKDWEAEEDCEVKSFLEKRQITSIQTSNHINVYPNPANDHLLLDYSNLEGEILKGRIINLNGRTIHIFNAASNKPEISVADLPSGLYFLQLETSETYYSTKFSILR